MRLPLPVPAWTLWLLLLLLLLPGMAQADAAYRHGLLWKVERGETPPSWIFGTIHTDDDRVVNLPEEVDHAFGQARAYLFEVDFLEVGAGTGMARMFYTDGRSLRDQLDDDTWRRARQAAAERGVPEQVAAMLKPWALATILALPETETTAILDFRLYQRAREKDAEVIALETADEQLAIFDDMPHDSQFAYLDTVLAYIDSNGVDGLYERLIELYLERDLAGMMRMAEDHPSLPGRDEDASLMRRLVDDRNRIMVTRMRASLDEGSAFIAVGALHLPGENGILRLLTEQGFQIERVY